MDTIAISGKIRVFFGLSITLFVIATTTFDSHRHIVSMLNFNAFLIIVGGVVGASMMGFRSKDSIRFWLGLFMITRADDSAFTIDHTLATQKLGSIAKAALSAGVLGNIIGLIHVMEYLDKPEAIGPGIAVAYLSSIYSLTVYLWCTSLQQNHLVLLRERGICPPEGTENQDMLMVGFVGFQMLLTCLFFVLYALQIR